MGDNIKFKRSHDYLTNFFRHYSIIALCSGICSLIFSFYGIIAGVIRTVERMKVNGFFAFAFFTMIANILAALSVAFIIPFAVEGIKKKRLVLPKWVAIFHYISTTSVAVMLVFVLAFISWSSPYDAFGDSNLFTHIFCPILILISFFQIENRYIYTVKDCFIGCIPLFIYEIVYYIEVVLIGEANGGWKDIYHVQEHLPTAVAILSLMLLGLGTSYLIATISNYLTKKHEQKMFLYWKNDIDPIEAKIEAYGLGNAMSKIKDENNITIPIDVLEYFSKKSNTNTDELIKSYVTGYISAQKEMDKHRE